MSRPVVSLLSVAGLVGLVLFLSYGQQTSGRTTTTRIGQPSPWYTREDGPDGTVWHANLWSTSTLIGAAGCVCLWLAWRGSRPDSAAGPRR